MGLSKATVDLLVKENIDHDCPGYPEVCVQLQAVADLPTRFGEYQAVAFWNNLDKKDHAAFIHGDVFEREEVPVRVHSECLTGDAIGSLRCDCRDQLLGALEWIGRQEGGIVLYLRQEGRGIGLANKIKAYHLQDAGYDTVQANELLGFRPDERDYAIAAHMLRSLHIKSIRLLTNNPSKVTNLKRLGVKVVNRIPLVVPPNEYNRPYLETKQKRMGHLLELEQSDTLKTDAR
ncbi:MAG: GTP cyclohydrolase II [Thermoplasmata archaeon]